MDTSVGIRHGDFMDAVVSGLLTAASATASTASETIAVGVPRVHQLLSTAQLHLTTTTLPACVQQAKSVQRWLAARVHLTLPPTVNSVTIQAPTSSKDELSGYIEYIEQALKQQQEEEEARERAAILGMNSPSSSSLSTAPTFLSGQSIIVIDNHFSLLTQKEKTKLENFLLDLKRIRNQTISTPTTISRGESPNHSQYDLPPSTSQHQHHHSLSSSRPSSRSSSSVPSPSHYQYHPMTQISASTPPESTPLEYLQQQPSRELQHALAPAQQETIFFSSTQTPFKQSPTSRVQQQQVTQSPASTYEPVYSPLAASMQPPPRSHSQHQFPPRPEQQNSQRVSPEYNLLPQVTPPPPSSQPTFNQHQSHQPRSSPPLSTDQDGILIPTASPPLSDFLPSDSPEKVVFPVYEPSQSPLTASELLTTPLGGGNGISASPPASVLPDDLQWQPRSQQQREQEEKVQSTASGELLSSSPMIAVTNDILPLDLLAQQPSQVPRPELDATSRDESASEPTSEDEDNDESDHDDVGPSPVISAPSTTLLSPLSMTSMDHFSTASTISSTSTPYRSRSNTNPPPTHTEMDPVPFFLDYSQPPPELTSTGLTCSASPPLESKSSRNALRQRRSMSGAGYQDGLGEEYLP